MERPPLWMHALVSLALAAACGACASLPRRGQGACVVHDISVEIPPFGASPAGKGYVIEALPGLYDLDSARAACVQSVFERLREVYNAQGNRGLVVWEVALYGPDGAVILSDTSSFGDGPPEESDNP